MDRDSLSLSPYVSVSLSRVDGEVGSSVGPCLDVDESPPLRHSGPGNGSLSRDVVVGEGRYIGSLYLGGVGLGPRLSLSLASSASRLSRRSDLSHSLPLCPTFAPLWFRIMVLHSVNAV